MSIRLKKYTMSLVTKFRELISSITKIYFDYGLNFE